MLVGRDGKTLQGEIQNDAVPDGQVADRSVWDEAAVAARLLYRDGLMLVLDKPAGIVVHQGPKGGANLDALFGGLRFGLPRNPALAHRLDRDTSGCLVLGRHRKALEKLGLLFKQGRITKTYWAVVEGEPSDDEGLIDLPLGRLDAARGWWMKVDPAGQPAQTPLPGARAWARAGGAGAAASHRPHPPAPGPLHGDGLADARRPDLRPWRRSAAPPRPSDPRAAGENGAGHRGGGTCSASHASSARRARGGQHQRHGPDGSNSRADALTHRTASWTRCGMTDAGPNPCPGLAA